MWFQDADSHCVLINWLSELFNDSHKQSGVSVNDSHIKTCKQKDSAVVLDISSQTNN